MTTLQQLFIVMYAGLNVLVFFKGYYESRQKDNAFGLVLPLSFLGIFVWGDAVVFGAFWIAVSLITLVLNDWYLFWLIVSLFWVVRGFGETIYWLNQQFSNQDRNPVRKSHLYSTFHNDSIWFVKQIMWQCVTVIALVASIYCAWRWLQGI